MANNTNCYECDQWEDSWDDPHMVLFDGAIRKFCNHCFFVAVAGEDIPFEALQEKPLAIVVRVFHMYKAFNPGKPFHEFPLSLKTQCKRFTPQEFAFMEVLLTELNGEEEEEHDEDEDPSSSSSDEIVQEITEDPKTKPKPKILKAKFRK